jgi:hypothetical protein
MDYNLPGGIRNEANQMEIIKRHLQELEAEERRNPRPPQPLTSEQQAWAEHCTAVKNKIAAQMEADRVTVTITDPDGRTAKAYRMNKHDAPAFKASFDRSEDRDFPALGIYFPRRTCTIAA